MRPPAKLIMKSNFFPLLSLLIFSGLCSLAAEEAVPPQVLFGPDIPGWEKQVAPNGTKQPDVSFTTGKDGAEIAIQAAGSSSFPGVRIAPEKPWDVSAHGRIEATVTNTSAKPMRISMRVDDSTGETGAATAGVQPGESRTVPVYLDYAAKAKLKSSAIEAILLFGTKAPTAQSFRIDRIVAAGPAGEKPPVDPKTAALKPAKGVMLGDGVTLDAAKQLGLIGPAKAAAETGALRLTFAGGADEGVTFKPALGFWNLNDYFQVRARVKNTGTAPVTPSVRVESKDGPTEAVPAGAPIAPGQSADIVVPFAATVPWEGSDDPDAGNVGIKKDFKGKPGTGTKFVSHRVTGVTVLGDKTPATLLVTSIAGENPVAVDLPEWLGKRPPVDGEWTKTFEDNFDGTSIDLTKWRIYAPNFWDKRTHFSKDNTIVKDGALTLRVERKTGRHNDSPDGKETDYATGFADTYGKWVQRYGYFEARVKLPSAPCLWPAFWLMPDRGTAKGDQGARQSTKFGGMEFDIVEQLSIWGSQRFNFAMHWDGYGAAHKATGSGGIYVPADKDGFLVVGLLWTPGSAVLYGNGKELARWESPRISNVASAILLDNVTGGWETESIDDAQLPGDFVLDYVRVWQRNDLATPEDGPKQDDGS
jgi:beta-glucanase (GH16 family)